MTDRNTSGAASGPDHGRHVSFGTALWKAADLLRELAELETKPKLTAESFLGDSMQLAGCTPERLVEIDEKLDNSANADRARAFIRILAAEVAKRNWPTPPVDTAKVMRVFGSEQGQHQLTEHGVTVAEAVALAAKHATERWPEDFGTVEDWQQHQERIAEIRARLPQLYETIEHNVTVQEIEIDLEGLTARERAKGLCRARLRLAPAVSLAPGWPERLARALTEKPELAAVVENELPRGEPMPTLAGAAANAAVEHASMATA